ncbi:hypothetical protein VTK26DRAFT_966 [Humicola hyalothermophila]
MLEKPEDLHDFCGLPSVPQLAETTRTGLVAGLDREDDKLHVFQIADVNWGQWYDLRRRTEGEVVIVWFQGRRRWCWLPRKLKKREEDGDRQDGKPRKHEDKSDDDREDEKLKEHEEKWKENKGKSNGYREDGNPKEHQDKSDNKEEDGTLAEYEEKSNNEREDREECSH